MTKKEKAWAGLADSPTRRVQNALRMPIRLICRGAARFKTSRTIILAYHSLGKGRDAVDEQEFYKQMRFLRANAQVVGLEAILRGEHLNTQAGLSCAITFDDGYASVYKIAAPILHAFNFPAIVYLTAGAIGETVPRSAARFPGLFQDETMLTWEQATELSRIGFTFGSHLCQHHDMTMLAERKITSELEHSKAIIAARLGVPCRHFAYPFGYFNRTSVELVRHAGYESAVTVMHRSVPRSCDPLRIPRMCIAPLHKLDDFTRMLEGEFDYLPLVQRTRRVLNLNYHV
ncbi:MAG: polysaccharide deacetylase family protein [Candidatus Binataceae bacterium]|jgi:peptidoglycan/xylan/chitin deacetylase (PgdA/CDA1 family)